MTKTSIVSIFSSIQGEGLYVGKPHLFIRFAGCNLRCHYCDTAEALVTPKYCRIEKSPFSKTSYNVINPIDNNYLFTKVKQLTSSCPVRVVHNVRDNTLKRTFGIGSNDSNGLRSPAKIATAFPYYHSIVLTGGEPLLHTPFLNKFLPQVRKFKIPIMLETNGT
ncbi:MAG: 7-carboxy-7-deazaguanine synthase QueE, partial [Planctomycetota bacterium]